MKREQPDTLQSSPERKPAEIGNYLAIMSGKGGVGKSAVTSLLAAGMKKRGLEVGILDADITGPSIPRMMGVSDRVVVEEDAMVPPLSAGGVKVMSANLILENEDDALIWRGPMVSNCLRQFWEETSWGKLDYLLVDLPPGTSDAPLTVMQVLPSTDVLIVTSPQVLASMIVRKAINMARRVGSRVIGVVENMGTARCPHCGESFELFRGEGTEQMVAQMKVPLLGKIPFDQRISELSDLGRIESYQNEEIDKLVGSVIELTSKA
ncbi:MAG: Mrp/NBP35 family ATP-binding protein [Actinobacteria bacterium]|nr:Mrp/NBP35 family ATP-binding protein [Actinomycetota bacterium]